MHALWTRTRNGLGELAGLIAFFGSMFVAEAALEGHWHDVIDVAGILGIGLAASWIVEYIRDHRPPRP